MSVVLINPPPLERVPARIVMPPMGLAYLASSLKARGVEAEVLDADGLDLSLDSIAARVRALDPKIVGVTAMSPTAEASYRVLEAVRDAAPVLVLGGPHPSALGAEVFADCPVRLEAAFAGEGEERFTEFVSRVLAGEPAQKIELPGLLHPGSAAGEGPWPVVEDLDGLPVPDRLSLPWRRYRHPLLGGEVVTTLITSRGCPYQCLFCDKHIGGSRWRPRSPASVMAEIEEIVSSTGVRRLIFYDDLFTFDRERAIEICKALIERDLRVRWKCEGRVNRIDGELLSWMKRAGCEMIAYGVETATSHGLEFLRKNITVDQVREAFAMTQAAGIQSLGYFLVGIPGETAEQEMETVRLAVSIGADYAQFGTLSPFPGTPLHDLAKSKGWLQEGPARGPAERGSRRPLLLDGYWTAERLDEMLRRAHRGFYFRPSYMARRLARFRSFKEVRAAASQGARLLGWWLKSRFGSSCKMM